MVILRNLLFRTRVIVIKANSALSSVKSSSQSISCLKVGTLKVVPKKVISSESNAEFVIVIELQSNYNKKKLVTEVLINRVINLEYFR